MLTDLDIAKQAHLEPMENIAARLGIPAEALLPYGRNKAKVDTAQLPAREPGKLVLVTAINPTPAGEGKTTTTIGLGDALSRRGVRTAIALRQPSLGPVFGMKGGAAGGGHAQVVPMEDINLHFTGDLHAIGAANNLLCALLDNHLQQGNVLQIDPQKIQLRRVVDMNDRALRNIVIGLGGSFNGKPREDGFDITVASEVMAVFCLAKSLEDLTERLARMVVAQNTSGQPVTAADLQGAGAMAVLLRDAFMPNLVQTLEHTPAFIHGGPFANIAHGCNSLSATLTAMRTADITVTEAGFGADLGAEKFFDIKCRQAGIFPNAVVLVATLRALKCHGGATKADWAQPNAEALQKGLCNLKHHLSALQSVYQAPVVVALNVFENELPAELAMVEDACRKLGAAYAPSRVHAQGGEGGLALAAAVLAACEKPTPVPHFCYEDHVSALDKMTAIVRRIYGGANVVLTPQATKDLAQYQAWGYGSLPVCMAKTQYSISDDPTLIGTPSGFTVTVRRVRLSAGAGFLVALTGDIMTMPGLPKTPAANAIRLDEFNQVQGLF